MSKRQKLPGSRIHEHTPATCAPSIPDPPPARCVRSVPLLTFPLLVALLATLFLQPAPAPAWPGHDYARWREVSTWKAPALRTDQSGKSGLVPLLAGGPDDQPINEIRVWEQRREQYAGAIRAILGEPTDLEPPPPQIEVLGEEKLDDHLRRRVRIRAEPDDWIPAYLLMPKKLPVTPAPAMICLHQTVVQGKKEPCGIEGDPDLAFALELVRRGYVCITPDAIGFGERIPEGAQPYHDSLAFYRRHPNWSFMGKMIWDVSRVIDALEILPEVDPLQIGCIGHSHGAYGTLFAAAFEPRIAAAVASCGFTTFRSDPTPDRWSHLTALIPQVGTYLPDAASIPFDWQHVCAMIAPRPLFVWYATQDRIFPNTDNLASLFEDVKDVFGLYGAADDLAWHAHDGPHRIPREGRDAAYAWLEDRLFPVGDLHRVPRNVDDWKARRETLKKVIRRSLGTMPPAAESFDLKVIDTEQLDGYERRLIEYNVEPDERVRAYLSIPPGDKGNRPAVLVLHQTTPEGKRESVGIAGDPSLAFAAELTPRGYMTLAPDSITAGERIDRFGQFDTRGHYLRHPDLSAMGKMLHDARQGLTLLAGRDGVDPARLGAIGHSLGAETALMLAAFDDRVRATVATCGYATLEADPGRIRWARDHWFSYMPKLRPVLTRGARPHWDWPDVVCLIAPRALYHYTARDDQIFTESESAYEAGEAARAVWNLYDEHTRFVNVIAPGPHAVNDESRKAAYAWLDEQLNP